MDGEVRGGSRGKRGYGRVGLREGEGGGEQTKEILTRAAARLRDIYDFELIVI